MNESFIRRGQKWLPIETGNKGETNLSISELTCLNGMFK
jgi:hypothetical protein